MHYSILRYTRLSLSVAIYHLHYNIARLLYYTMGRCTLHNALHPVCVQSTPDCICVRINCA